MVEVPRDLVNEETGFDPVTYTPIRPTISAADPHDVEAAAKLLIQARCPVILAGQGVLYAEASDQLVKLAELLQAPVMTTVDGKSAFPENHALSLGSGGNTFTGHGRLFLYTKADLILGIGTGLNRHPLTTPPLPKGVPIIHATNDTRDLHKQHQTEVALLGDAKLVLTQLVEAVKDRLGGKLPNASPAAEIAAERAAWLTRWEAKLRSRETPITPYHVMSEFIRVVDPAGAIVTHNSGSPRDQLLPFYCATRPRGYLGWGKSHQLGTGLGLAIGAKVAAPDKFCVNFMGDAAFGMTGLDIETAVRAGIPSLTIVLNNNTMAIEIPHMKLSHEMLQVARSGRQFRRHRAVAGRVERAGDRSRRCGRCHPARQAGDRGRPHLFARVCDERGNRVLSPEWLGRLAACDCWKAGFALTREPATNAGGYAKAWYECRGSSADVGRGISCLGREAGTAVGIRRVPAGCDDRGNPAHEIIGDNIRFALRSRLEWAMPTLWPDLENRGRGPHPLP